MRKEPGKRCKSAPPIYGQAYGFFPVPLVPLPPTNCCSTCFHANRTRTRVILGLPLPGTQASICTKPHVITTSHDAPQSPLFPGRDSPTHVAIKHTRHLLVPPLFSRDLSCLFFAATYCAVAHAVATPFPPTRQPTPRPSSADFCKKSRVVC